MDLLAGASVRRARLIGVSLLLVFVSISALLSATISSGLFPELNRMAGITYSGSPTATYAGYLSISYTGTYHYMTVVPTCHNNFPPCLFGEETLLYLVTEDGKLLQLFFYCGESYCAGPNNIPIPDGARLHVKGTLLVPSAWQPHGFEPALNFTGDLYVFSYDRV